MNEPRHEFIADFHSRNSNVSLASWRTLCLAQTMPATRQQAAAAEVEIFRADTRTYDVDAWIAWGKKWYGDDGDWTADEWQAWAEEKASGES